MTDKETLKKIEERIKELRENYIYVFEGQEFGVKLACNEIQKIIEEGK